MDDKIKAIRDGIKKLRQDFDTSISQFQKNEFSEAQSLAKKSAEKLRLLSEKIGEVYTFALIQNKMPDLPSDEKRLAKAMDDNEEGSLELLNILLRQRDYIAILEREEKRIFPSQKFSQLKKLASPRVLLISTLALVVLIGGPLLYSHSKRKIGLRGEYFSKKNLSGTKRVHRNDTVNFNWGTSSPLLFWKKDDFSIRWTGFIRVETDSTYQFTTRSDDGVRLWIDGTQLINNWNRHKVTTDTGTIALAPGYHTLKLEYFEEKKTAQIQLLWKTDLDPAPQVIKPAHLVPSKRYLDPDLPVYPQ